MIEIAQMEWQRSNKEAEKKRAEEQLERDKIAKEQQENARKRKRMGSY